MHALHVAGFWILFHNHILLGKGITAPSQISSAYAGNFFVRERGRKILDALVFHPTVEKKTRKPTDWFLAVPKQLLEIPGRKADKPFCSKCGEAKRGNLVFATIGVAPVKPLDSNGIDVFKSRQWRTGNIAEADLAKTNEYRAQSNMPLLP